MRKLEAILADQMREDERDLSSRSDARRATKVREIELAQVASKLVDLAPKQLAKLQLPEELCEAVAGARAMSNDTARNRQLRVVRKIIREGATEQIEQALHRLLNPEPGSSPSDRWVARLVQEGDPAIDAFVQDFPAAERQRLRQLVRSVARASETQLATKRRALRRALLAWMKDT